MEFIKGRNDSNTFVGLSAEQKPSLVTGGAGPSHLERIVATRVAGGFDAPLFVTSAPGDAGRLYVLEKDLGQIVLLDPSTGARSIFLDIPANQLSTDGERGHPADGPAPALG